MQHVFQLSLVFWLALLWPTTSALPTLNSGARPTAAEVLVRWDEQCRPEASSNPHTLIRCIFSKITQVQESTCEVEEIFYNVYLRQSSILDLMHLTGSDVDAQLHKIMDVHTESVVQDYTELTEDQLQTHLPLDYAVHKKKAALALLFWKRWREILDQQDRKLQDDLAQLWAVLPHRGPLEVSEENLAELEIALREVHFRNMLRLVQIAVLEQNERLLNAHLRTFGASGHGLQQLFSLALTWPRALDEPRTREAADTVYREIGPVVGVDRAVDCLNRFGFTHISQGVQRVLGNPTGYGWMGYPAGLQMSVDECNDLLLLQPTATITLPGKFRLPVHLPPVA
ncbi:hypothetical protein H4R34_002650 [Dimargaris verticillata]|uniref:Uncharacterized protein n=1 Tax=Dimargaris verticillata TaxID=2761393 RepID=A0A9W8B648_9FUNG|nr:hypothetical protein H4R34_002650 [Dimargaris verticillata]